MKKRIICIIAVVLVIASLGIAGYPFISNYLNSKNSDSEVVQYLASADDLSEDESRAILNRAIEYNKKLLNSYSQISDPFSEDKIGSDEYNSMLLTEGSSAMAAIEIPSIDISLPIYHGTSKETLKKGIGHLASSSLPVGGKGTHTVLTGHTGFSIFKLFSDLDKLEQGDIFLIHTLGETLAYEVDNIAVVLPTDTDLLQIDPDKDYVTLVTCTPFGVNSHRLLVRGKRVEYNENMQTPLNSHIEESTWNNEYQQAIIIGAAVMASILALFAVIKLILFIVRKRKKDEN